MPIMIREGVGFSKRASLVWGGLLFLLFAGLTALVVAGTTDRLDLRLSHAAVRRTIPWLTTLLGWASTAAQPLVALLLAPIAWSLLRRQFRLAATLLGSVAGSSLLNLALKAILRHEPPGNGAATTVDWTSPPLHLVESISDSYGYPSGHVQTAVVALGLWLLWLWPWLPRPARRALPPIAALFVATLAYSRVYLGHHFVTDVIGGALLGGAWLAGTLWVAGTEEASRRRGERANGRERWGKPVRSREKWRGTDSPLRSE